VGHRELAGRGRACCMCCLGLAPRGWVGGAVVFSSTSPRSLVAPLPLATSVLRRRASSWLPAISIQGLLGAVCSIAVPPKAVSWPLEAHTAAKHEILRRYLSAWYPKLANSGRNSRLVVLDGFCGPGIYAKGEKGSPIIALETLLDHSAFANWSATTFVFAFFDETGAGSSDWTKY